MRLIRFVIVLCLVLTNTVVEAQDNKVVVIPLGGNTQDLRALPQMEWASVEANGDIVFATSGIDVPGSFKGFIAGTYTIQLNRNTQMCTAQVTLGHLQQFGQNIAGEVRVEATNDNQGIFVDTNDSTGANADLPFNILVICPTE